MTDLTGTGIRRTVLTAGGVGLVVVLVAVAIIFATSDQWTGRLLFENASSNAGLRETIEMLVSAHDGFVTLVTLAIGAVAFVITYQREKNIRLERRAMLYLSFALVLLIGALLCALLANELLFTMVGRGTIDLTLPALAWARRILYVMILLASICVGLFALEVLTGRQEGQKPRWRRARQISPPRMKVKKPKLL